MSCKLRLTNASLLPIQWVRLLASKLLKGHRCNIKKVTYPPMHKVCSPVQWVHNPCCCICKSRNSISCGGFFSDQLPHHHLTPQLSTLVSPTTIALLIQICSASATSSTSWDGNADFRCLNIRSSHSLSVSVTRSTYNRWPQHTQIKR